MENKKFTLKYLTGNKKIVAVFSVFIAFVVWLSVVINQTPTIEKTISVPINIDIQNTAIGESGMQEITGALERRVSVRVQGPAYIVSNLKPEDIEVTPLLQSINVPGQYSVSLTTKRSSNGDYTILEVTPSVITAKFDYVTEKAYNVEIEADGIKIDSAVSGLIDRGLKFNNPGENSVRIAGPQTETDKIDRVIARVTKKDTIKETTGYDAEIVLLDASGNELDKALYTISASEVKVSRVVYKKKTVPVKAVFSNAPAGFSNSVKWKLSDQNIEIMGEPEALNSINEITFPPIDLRQVSKSNNKIVMPLELGGGAESVDNTTSVTVTFDLSNCKERTFTVSEIVAENADGVKVALASAIKGVKICGPTSVINSVSASDIIAKVDISGKTAGEYIMPIEIVSRSGKVIWQIGTYEASVKVE